MDSNSIRIIRVSTKKPVKSIVVEIIPTLSMIIAAENAVNELAKEGFDVSKLERSNKIPFSKEEKCIQATTEAGQDLELIERHFSGIHKPPYGHYIHQRGG